MPAGDLDGERAEGCWLLVSHHWQNRSATFDADASLRLTAESLGLVDRLGADPIAVRNVSMSDRTLVVEITARSTDSIVVRGDGISSGHARVVWGGPFCIRVTRPCQPEHMSSDALGTRPHRGPALAALLDLCLDFGACAENRVGTSIAGRATVRMSAAAVACVTGHEPMTLAHGHRCCKLSASLGFAHGAAADPACKFERRDALMNGVEHLVGRAEHGRTCRCRSVPGPLRGRCLSGPRGQGGPRTGYAAGRSHSLRDRVLDMRLVRHGLVAS